MCSGGGALLCNVNKRNPLLNSIRRKLYVFLTVIFLSLSCFGEVPHSYVTDNPNTQINKIETIKEREKAELNLSVTKVKSKEVQGQIDEINKKIILILPEEFHNKSLVVVEGLEDLPNPSTVQGRKILTKALNNRQISDNLSQKIEKDNIIVNYKNKPEKLYVSDLNGSFYKWKVQIKDFMKQPRAYESYVTLEIDDRYNDEWIKFNNNSLEMLNNPKGINLIDKSGYGIIVYDRDLCEEGKSEGNIRHRISDWNINGHNISYNKTEVAYKTWSYEAPEQIIQISSDLVIKFNSINKIPKFELIKYPKHDFQIIYIFSTTTTRYGSQGNHHTTGLNSRTILNFKYIVRTLEGQSVLTAKEYYPVNQFINFNSTTMEEGSPLALENSLRDVSLTTSGKGIVTMEQGDKLEIDGKQVVIGAGGNIAEQKATIGNLEYTYKVENGKLRLALNKWGVLEPDRNLMIRVWRTKDGAESKLV